MNKEHDIDDILKMLKDSVSSEKSDVSVPASEDGSIQISTEDIQEQLKNQYINDTESSRSGSDIPSEYVIDSDFLMTALKDFDTPEEEIPTDDIVKEDSVIVEEIELPPIYEKAYEPEELLDIDGDIQTNEISTLDVAQEIDEQGDKKAVSVITHEAVGSVNTPSTPKKKYFFEEFDDEFEEELYEEKKVTEIEQPARKKYFFEEFDDELEEQFEEESIEGADQAVSEEQIVAEEIIEEEIVKEQLDTVQSSEEPHETFLASMRKTGIDFSSEEINKELLSADVRADDLSLMEDVSVEDIIGEDKILEQDIDASAIDMIMQFYQKDELEQTIGVKKVDEFIRSEQATIPSPTPSHVTEGKEYTSVEQNEQIILKYKKKAIRKLCVFASCAFIALLTIVYELLPIFGVRLPGIFSYKYYPAVYVLFGLQLLVLALTVKFKDFWIGLRRAFSPLPSFYSISSLLIVFTAVYDIVIILMLSITGDDLPNMYNGVAILVLALTALSDYLRTVSEKSAFAVYAEDAAKFTLAKENVNSKIGAKMYGGGLEQDKNIYSVQEVDFPSGFFRSVSDKHKTSRLLSVLILPIIVIGLLASIVAMLTDVGEEPPVVGAYTACSTFLVCLYATIPVILTVCDILPYTLACKRLAKRGSAFAGKSAIDKYSEADVVVFEDYHIFKKCKTEDIGIAIYDNKTTYLMFGCFMALYSKIGGPLSGMQINLPDVYSFSDARIRRITRNGVEAIIDKRHSIIVGEQSFMSRYGLVFPENDTIAERSTLCIAINGKVSAKMSVKYETEPIFEMLVERLYEMGITCAIQTSDPLINSSLVAASRTIGRSPISVLHSNLQDFSVPAEKRYREDADGVICCSSRLKLAEVAVWLKKLSHLKSVFEKLAAVFSCIGATALVALLSFNFYQIKLNEDKLSVLKYVDQRVILIYLLAELLCVAVVTLATLPSKKYLTIDKLYAELEREHTKQMTADKKKRSKQIKKIAKKK